MLPIKKLYIDSRDRTADSVSESSFRVDLPQVIQMPANSVFFITDVCIPHVWTTIESGINDKLYLWVIDTTVPVVQANINAYYVITMTAGNYTAATLAQVLQTSLNNTVPDNSHNLFTCRNTSGANDLQIAINISNRSVVILSDNSLTTLYASQQLPWVNGTVDFSNLSSMNDIIKNYARVSAPHPLDTTHPYNIDFVNLQPVNNVYMTSPTLGSYDTLSTFSNNVIKKIPVTADYGYMIVDQFIAMNDFLDCSKQTFKTLEFHLRDGRGRVINLHGSHISFSIVFNKYSEDA